MGLPRRRPRPRLGGGGGSEGRASEPTCRAAGISTRPTPSAPKAGYLVGAVGKTPRDLRPGCHNNSAGAPRGRLFEAYF